MLTECANGAGVPSLPQETKATCQQCAMCSPTAPEGSPEFFHPHVKCCSYEPALPNFLVGRILRDSAPEWQFGRETVAQRMARGLGVTPWGLETPRRYGVLYGGGHGVFGRSPELRCSHYKLDDDSCGIWPHRNGVCATWFCKHERGAKGLRFWRALSALITEVEWSLGLWCVQQLDPSIAELERITSRAPAALTPGDLGGPPDDRAHGLAWGKWAGQEVEFYVEAASLVDGLGWSEIDQICGVRTRVLAGLVRDANDALSAADVPERLVMGHIRITGAREGAFVVQGYSSSDPVRLPEILMRALPHFDGRTTNETLEEIRTESGVSLSSGLLRKLIDFELLKDAADEARDVSPPSAPPSG